MALKHGEPSPPELLVWQMAEKFGWTLEYIEGLSMAKIHEFIQVEDGLMKARSADVANNSRA